MSFTQISMWESNPELYRMTYYYNEGRKLKTPEINFGKKIAELLQKKDPSVKWIRSYEFSEYEMLVDVAGVPVLAYIDSFSKRRKKFLEYKTAQNMKSWSDVKVAKHFQLDLYSLLVQVQFGKVEDECELIVLETKPTEVVYKGRVLEQVDKGLQLTGRKKIFKRSIKQWERDYMRDKIIRVAKEISDDYQKFKKEESFLRGDEIF